MNLTVNSFLSNMYTDELLFSNFIPLQRKKTTIRRSVAIFENFSN